MINKKIQFRLLRYDNYLLKHSETSEHLKHDPLKFKQFYCNTFSTGIHMRSFLVNNVQSLYKFASSKRVITAVNSIPPIRMTIDYAVLSLLY